MENSQPTRAREFLEFARVIVEDEPGLTAKEVYYRVMQAGEGDMNLVLSDSLDPQNSLTSTLRKDHGFHGMERWKAQDGVFRFYPKGYVERLAQELKRIRDKAPPRALTTQTVLFGIKYANEIGCLPTTTITQALSDENTYEVEVNLGRSLSRYVTPTQSGPEATSTRGR